MALSTLPTFDNIDATSHTNHSVEEMLTCPVVQGIPAKITVFSNLAHNTAARDSYGVMVECEELASSAVFCESYDDAHRPLLHDPDKTLHASVDLSF